MEIERLRDVHPQAEIVENEAVETASVFQRVNDNPFFGKPLQGLLALGGQFHFGEISREKPVKQRGDLLPGSPAGRLLDAGRHAVGVLTHGDSGVIP